MTEERPDFELRVSADRMAVMVSCVLAPDLVGTVAARVQSELESLGISHVDVQALEQSLLEVANTTSYAQDVPVMMGEPPVDGRDGFIAWSCDFFSKGFVIDEATGAADYRRRVAQASVAPGQLLGRVMPPVAGRNGIDVYGKAVPAAPCRAAAFRVGRNVRLESESGEFYAETSGRIRWTDRVLAVDQVYTIEGNVGLKTGHIHHPGALVIERDVEAGAEVVADGDVEVHGTVEAATIRAGGNLNVHGGIAGGADCKIVADGHIHARYIMDAHVESGGDVQAESAIMHSVLKSRGMVAVAGGRLFGGDITALGGIKAAQIGSEGLAPTRVTVGVDYQLAQLLDELQRQVDALEKELSALRAELALRRQRKAPLGELSGRIERAETAREGVFGEMQQVKQQSRELAKPFVWVRACIFPETTLSINGVSLRLTEQHLGPVCASCAEDRIELQPLVGEGSG